MKKGDVVKRTDKRPDNSVAWIELSPDTHYVVEDVVDGGLLVLETFWSLVHPSEVELVN